MKSHRASAYSAAVMWSVTLARRDRRHCLCAMVAPRAQPRRASSRRSPGSERPSAGSRALYELRADGLPRARKPAHDGADRHADHFGRLRIAEPFNRDRQHHDGAVPGSNWAARSSPRAQARSSTRSASCRLRHRRIENAQRRGSRPGRSLCDLPASAVDMIDW